MDLFVLGKAVIEGDEMSWEIQGIFDSEEKALQSCTHKLCFIRPMKLNEVVPDTTEEWPGAYYPLIEKQLCRLQENSE